jgi:ornithine cyclodeaminase/alanine dehydrogenase-like protein (mu-crystallin family)
MIKQALPQTRRRAPRNVYRGMVTGTVLQDVAAAAAVYEKVLAANVGTWFNFLG